MFINMYYSFRKLQELRENIQKLVNEYKEMKKDKEILEEKVKFQEIQLEMYKDLIKTFILWDYPNATSYNKRP